jgi:hypothetical protein
MKFSIERGLGGRITTNFDPSGVRHEVRLPKKDKAVASESRPAPHAENGEVAGG